MVLFALGVSVASVFFLAYKYAQYRLSSRPLKPSEIKHATTRKGSENKKTPEGYDKSQPAFMLTAPEAPDREADILHVNIRKMKNPFENEKSQNQTKNNMPLPSSKVIPNSEPTLSTDSMPPPLRSIPKPSIIQKPPKPSNSTSLRPTASTASILRSPAGRNPTASSLLAPSISTLAPSSRPSRKVILEPGHSPLDWADLISKPPSSTFLRGADVPPNLTRVPPSLLKRHNGRKDKETGELKDAWGVWQGKVYNMSPYMKFHPGGADQLMRGAGNMKAEQLFNETHSWVSWDNMLGECLVGILVSENEAHQANDMEQMD